VELISATLILVIRLLVALQLPYVAMMEVSVLVILAMMKKVVSLTPFLARIIMLVPKTNVFLQLDVLILLLTLMMAMLVPKTTAVLRTV
jgi:hypothetical protein